MPTILAAAAVGTGVLLGGNLPWAVLGPLNLRAGVSLPWAIVPMAAYLWFYWRFLDGNWGGDTASRAARHANLRVGSLTAAEWVAAIVAGLVGFGAVLAWLALAARMVRLPDSAPILTPPEMPALTAAVLLSMQSVVAGVSEEAAFRGYMQSMIERQYGVVIAIVLNGTLFGLLHFGNHPADTFLMLPYYIVVSAVYGGLTWATRSIKPAIVLHSAGDIVMLIRWWRTGLPEWQLSMQPPAVVWESGVDGGLVWLIVGTLALSGLTGLAYCRLRRVIVPATTL